MRPARLHERNIAPAGHSTTWLTSSVKEISPLLAQNGQNTAFFGVPGRRIFHGTPQHLTRGRFFFHPSPIPTPRRDKTHPARPHQRPSGKKFSQHAQNTPKSALFRLQGEFFLGLTQNPRLQGEFFTLMGATATSQHPPTASPETDDTMRVDHCHEMKPLTPLLAQNSQIQAIFRPQRCHGFHAPLAEHPQRRCRFHPRRTLRPQPKPRVACAHATRPVAHWPHD